MQISSASSPNEIAKLQKQLNALTNELKETGASDMDAEAKQQKVQALQAQIQMVQAQIAAIQRQNQQEQIEKQKQAETTKAQQTAPAQAPQNGGLRAQERDKTTLGSRLDTFARPLLTARLACR